MEIQLIEDKYLVKQGDNIIYEALTQDEAQGYIDWVNRPDAGNPGGCIDCP